MIATSTLFLDAAGDFEAPPERYRATRAEELTAIGRRIAGASGRVLLSVVPEGR
jgi:hypothetical protein